MKYYGLTALVMAASAALLGQAPVVTDDIAYGHLFLMLAPSTEEREAQYPSDSLAERQAAYTKHVGLNPEQGDILIRIAGKYHSYLEGLRAQATQIAGPPVEGAYRTARQRAQLKSIASGRQVFLIELIRELHEELDDQGDRIVRDHIRDRVKPNVRFK